MKIALTIIGCMAFMPALALLQYLWIRFDKNKGKAQFAVTKILNKFEFLETEWIGAYEVYREDGAVSHNAMVVFNKKQQNVWISNEIYRRASKWVTIKYIVGWSGSIYIESVS